VTNEKATYCNYTYDSGKGKIASNGTVKDITWSVEDKVLTMKDTDGNPVYLNHGKTWIGLASSNHGGKAEVK
jgi:hypothetical protein